MNLGSNDRRLSCVFFVASVSIQLRVDTTSITATVLSLALRTTAEGQIKLLSTARLAVSDYHLAPPSFILSTSPIW